MTKVKIHRRVPVATIPVKQVKLNGESIYPLTAAEGVVFSDGSLLSDKTFGATSYLKVDELPETGNPSIIYLVESEDTDTGDLYDEYFWSTADNAFEKFGHKVDLSNYPTFFEVGNQLDAVKTYVDNSFEDQELVVASALNDLNDRTKSLESNNASLASTLNNMQNDIYDLQDRNVFTTEERAKLASAITGISVDGTAQTVTNGVVDLSIPEGVWSAGEGEGSAILTGGGENISATGVSSVAEGNGIAQGTYSHAEGGYLDGETNYLGGTAYGQGSHAEGRNTYAIGGASHSSGLGSSTEVTYTDGSVSDTILTLTPSAEILVGQVYKIGENYYKITAVSVNNSVYTLTLDKTLGSIDASGSIYKIRGVAYGATSFVGGQQNIASGINAVATGGNNIVSGNHSFASGTNNTVSGAGSFVAGSNNTISGNYSSAVGRYDIVSGGGSLAIGLRNTVSGVSSFATGQGNDAAGNASAAIGLNCTPTTQGAVTIGDHTHVFSSGSNHGGIAIGYSWYGDWKPVGDANATSYTNTYYSSDVSNEMLQISESVLGKMYVGCIITDYESPESRAKILTCTAVKSDSTITWTFTTDKTLSSTALDGTKAYYIPLTIANYWSFAFNGMALGGRSIAMGRGATTLNSYGVSIGNHTLTKSTNAECAFGQWNASNSGTTFSVGIGNSTLRKNGIELNGGKFYINGVGTYDGTNPISGTNDLASVLATKADSTNLSGKEDVSNKVTSLSASSTDTEYPSAKCVYDMIGDIESVLDTIINGTSNNS